jgi:hypothetical protein
MDHRQPFPDKIREEFPVKRFGPASELRTKSDAWKKVDEMGIRSEINKDSPDAGTFSVLALRYLEAETRDYAAV